MTRAINLAALQSAEVRTAPWRWAQYEGAFLEPEELINVYPAAGMAYTPQRRYATESGEVPQAQWSSQDPMRTLVDIGAGAPVESCDLDKRWMEVAADLLSEEYREVLSDITEIDLRTLKMRATFHTFNEMYSCRPHLDDEWERVVHLLYLDGTDSVDDGGLFQVLTSSDPKDLVAEVAPRPNQGIVQVRSENSWHCVTPPTAGKKLPRKMLHVTWEENH